MTQKEDAMTEKKDTLDMTRGKPLSLILSFALPILLGNCFQLVYGTVDTMVAGYFLGEGAIAAIGATGVIFSLIMTFSWGLNGGYCISLSRAFGSGDRALFKKCAAAMLTLNLIVTIILTAASLLLIEPAMRLLKTPDEIFSEALSYITVVIAGLFATVAYNMASGFMNSVGNSRTPLFFLIFSSLLNVALDVLFVVVLSCGIWGCAVATVIAQAISAVLGMSYIARHYKELLPQKKDFAFDKDVFAELGAQGLSMALMHSVVGLGTVALQRAINLLGTEFVAAHAASRRLFDLLMVPMSTLAIANSTFTSQNYGAGKLERVREANKKLILIELAWSIFSLAFSFALGKPLARALTGSQSPAIIENAALYLRFSTLFFFPLGVLFVLRYSMQALGHKALPVISSAIELSLKFVFAFAVVPSLGYWGVIMTEPVTWVLCALLLAASYLTVGRQRG